MDVDMRVGFEGLAKTLKENKIDVKSLEKGSLIIFLNRKATAFKLLAGKEYVVYYKNGHRRIPLDAIQYLPTFFDGAELDFNKAVEKSIIDKVKLGKKRK